MAGGFYRTSLPAVRGIVFASFQGPGYYEEVRQTLNKWQIIFKILNNNF